MTETDLHDLFEALDYMVAHVSTAKHRLFFGEVHHAWLFGFMYYRCGN